VILGTSDYKVIFVSTRVLKDETKSVKTYSEKQSKRFCDE
jgi:hypothetical protein